MELTTVGTPALWMGFTAIVLIMLALDLGVFHRTAHTVRLREALIWSVVWIGLALLFNLWIYRTFGADRGLEFLAGYRAASLAAVTCRVKVPMMGGFPFDHLARSPAQPGDGRREKRGGHGTSEGNVESI